MYESNQNIDKTLNAIRNKILKRGDLPYITVEKQLAYLDELTKFPLGKSLILSKVIDSYWIDYLISNQFNATNEKKKKGLLLKDFIENFSPFINSQKEVYKNFQNIIQSRISNKISIASIPSGVMRDVLTLDYSRVRDFKLFGVDIDIDVLEATRQLAANMGLSKHLVQIQENAWKLNFENELDIISSCGLNIYTINRKDCLKLYEQFFKALRPGGVLIINFLTYPPNHKNFSEWKTRSMNFNYLLLDKILFEDLIELECKSYRSSFEFKNELESIGFKNIDFIYDQYHISPVVVAHKP